MAAEVVGAGSGETPSTPVRIFTPEEVAQHNQASDCFVIIHGVVYDVTDYLPQHPGKVDTILRKAGQDVTADFEALFHSARARNILQRLFVGIIDPARQPKGLNPRFMARGGAMPTAYPPRGGGGGASRLPTDAFGRIVPAATSPGGPSAEHFFAVTLEQREAVTPTTDLLVFSYSHVPMLVIPPGHHLTFFHGALKRPYTPVECTPGRFQLLVKCYPTGLMTPHLHTMAIGASIKCAGPVGTFDLAALVAAKTPPRLLMLCGGTGITPFYAILRSLAQAQPGLIHVVLVYSVTHSAEFLLTAELDALQDQVPVQIVRTVTREDAAWTGAKGRVDRPFLEALDLRNISDLLVCGPPRFNIELRMLASSMVALREARVHVFQ